jgi:hypothetical protein
VARSVIHQLAPWCQHIVIVCSLCFNFAWPFDFGCCLLAKQPVDHYLPYFRQRLISCLLSALLTFQHLFTESLCGDLLLVPPAFCDVLSEFPPSLLCANFPFLVYWLFFFFFLLGGHSAHGLCWFIPGVAGGISCDAWLSPVWSAECLPSRFGAVEASALLSSLCNVAWRFPPARGSGVSFDSPWCFISSKSWSSVSARFLIHGVHTVYFCTLVAILAPPHGEF